jgi:hypothetical protein
MRSDVVLLQDGRWHRGLRFAQQIQIEVDADGWRVGHDGREFSEEFPIT